MDFLNLFASIELISNSSVPSRTCLEGTLEIQENQVSSPGSLSSPYNNQEDCNFIARDIQLALFCKCEYWLPFSTSFLKFLS